MSLEIFKIREAPYHRATWVKLREVCDFVKCDRETIVRICRTINAQVIVYGVEYIDFDVLGRSASWRQLVSSASAAQSQGDLFSSKCQACGRPLPTVCPYDDRCTGGTEEELAS